MAENFIPGLSQFSSIVLHNGKAALPIKAGQANVFKAKAGEHYRVLKGSNRTRKCPCFRAIVLFPSRALSTEGRRGLGWRARKQSPRRTKFDSAFCNRTGVRIDLYTRQISSPVQFRSIFLWETGRVDIFTLRDLVLMVFGVKDGGGIAIGQTDNFAM